MDHINPVKRLGRRLLDLEKPARYASKDFGAIVKGDDCALTFGIAFPDLYEIGMSNQAVRVLYNGLNSIESVRCERVFAPAPDYEALLKSEGLALTTLESSIPLEELDVLGVSMGYELGGMGMLSILDTGRIELHAANRGEGDPIVILGGVATSNPLPYARFIDAAWVGEAEAGFFELIERVSSAKAAGSTRTKLLSTLREHPSIWYPGKKAVRAVYQGFGKDGRLPAVFPIPSLRVVQDHGAVEIMRGCPNGCRFCHAGIYYRPTRAKPFSAVKREVEAFVSAGGYREVTLSSLSSGDYPCIGSLVSSLSRAYEDQRVSFQLPSLKISTFALPILESISQVRKSGLTFAVETPVDGWQRSINKEVYLQSVIDIMLNAKAEGWKQAKFYFMIGLPVGLPQDAEDDLSEADEIIRFLTEVQKATRMSLNANIGTFVPKPHTPYQWVKQISVEESGAKLGKIKEAFRRHPYIKISVHDTFTSQLEGVLSRGDTRVGDLLLEAYKLGCRLDAWEDFLNREAWSRVLNETSVPWREFLEGIPVENELPWAEIDPGVGLGYLKREFARSRDQILTNPCETPCGGPCGACTDAVGLALDPETVCDEEAQEVQPDDNGAEVENPLIQVQVKSDTYRMVFCFSKSLESCLLPHLSLIEVFSRTFARAHLNVTYTKGFNPLPRLDFAAALSVGIVGLGEVATVDFDLPMSPQLFIESMNRYLPEGVRVEDAELFVIPFGSKKVSASALLWGFEYPASAPSQDGLMQRVPAKEEKTFRASLLAELANAGDQTSFLKRVRVLARNQDQSDPIGYLEAYRQYYGVAGTY